LKRFEVGSNLIEIFARRSQNNPAIFPRNDTKDSPTKKMSSKQPEQEEKKANYLYRDAPIHGTNLLSPLPTALAMAFLCMPIPRPK